MQSISQSNGVAAQTEGKVSFAEKCPNADRRPRKVKSSLFSLHIFEQPLDSCTNNLFYFDLLSSSILS